MSLKPSTHTLTDNDILELTVRFSASIPDLLLSISLTSQPNANTSTLKQLIREHLPSEYTKRRIRLIHAGKALADDAPLATTLKRNVSRPPSRVPTPAPYTSQDEPSPTAKLKGKAPVRDPPLSLSSSRIYIHCSIGDVILSTSELSAEKSLASPSQLASSHPQDVAVPVQPEAPAPRGFDRLLAAGFSPSEIHSLRLQFLSIQSHTHTPDTMPSPNTMRDMEDQWLDNSSSLPSDPTATDGGSGGGYTDDEAGMLDDMIFGAIVGFFWPIGCLVWGARDEGVWSERRRTAVVMGVVLNFALGIVRYTS